MARKTGIRWNKTLADDLRREVANYNKRVRRASVKVPTSLLPPTYKVKDLKEAITSKKEYNAIIRGLRSARAETLKLNKSGTATIWQEKQDRAYQRSIAKSAVQAKREKLLENVDTSQRLGRLWDNRDFFIRELQRTQGSSVLDKLQNWISGDKVERSELWRENYLKALKDQIEFIGIYDDETADDLVNLYNKIQNMDLIDFLIAQLAEPAELSIAFLGSGNRRRDISGAMVDRIIDVWSKYG